MEFNRHTWVGSANYWHPSGGFLPRMVGIIDRPVSGALRCGGEKVMTPAVSHDHLSASSRLGGGIKNWLDWKGRWCNWTEIFLLVHSWDLRLFDFNFFLRLRKIHIKLVLVLQSLTVENASVPWRSRLLTDSLTLAEENFCFFFFLCERRPDKCINNVLTSAAGKTRGQTFFFFISVDN